MQEKDREIRSLSECIVARNSENKRLVEENSRLKEAVKEREAEATDMKDHIKKLTAALLACKIRAQKNIEDLEELLHSARSEAAKAQREVSALEAETSQLRIALVNSYNATKERCDTEAEANCTRLEALFVSYKTFTSQALEGLEAIRCRRDEYEAKAKAVTEWAKGNNSSNDDDERNAVLGKALFQSGNTANCKPKRPRIPTTPTKAEMDIEGGTPSQTLQPNPFVLGTQLKATHAHPGRGGNNGSGDVAVVAVTTVGNPFNKENEDSKNC